MTRAEQDLDAELAEYRSLMELHLARPIPDEEWAIFRRAHIHEHSAVRAEDVAPLEDCAASAVYWRRQDSWTFNETYLLLVGVDPNRLDTLLKRSDFEAFSVPLVADPIGKMMKRAEQVGRLRFPVRPADLIRWAAREKGIKIPPELRMLSAVRSGTGDDKADFVKLARPLFDSSPLQSAVLEIIQADDRFGPYLLKYQPTTIKGWLREADPRPPSSRQGRPKKG